MEIVENPDDVFSEVGIGSIEVAHQAAGDRLHALPGDDDRVGGG
jgi:hypothetical protein